LTPTTMMTLGADTDFSGADSGGWRMDKISSLSRDLI